MNSQNSGGANFLNDIPDVLKAIQVPLIFY